MKKVRILNGYRVIYEPDYPFSMTNENWKGYIYEHRYVMEQYLGRQLEEDEVVHHIDCNIANNRLDNLLLLSRAMHSKLHFWIDTGCFIHESYNRDRTAIGKTRTIEPAYCENCGKTLQNKQKKTCSVECSKVINTNPDKPTKEQLQNDMETLSWLAIGRKYNVSDNGARKWAKNYNLL
jgi:predicted nucleic acid-binding Zn ribbon protein